jgi:AraC-like DNA-binding protein
MDVLEILEKKIIPWAEAGALKRVVVGGVSRKKYPLPAGMRRTPVKMKGRRVGMQGTGSQSHMKNYLAHWPEDGLVEMRLPFIGCVVSGSVEYQAGRHIYHCTEGDFLLIPPNVPHRNRPVTDENGMVIVPDILAFSTWDNHRQCCVCRGIDRNYLLPDHGTVQLLDLLIDELLTRRPGFERASHNIFLAFLSLLCRELSEQHYFRSGVGVLDIHMDEPKVDPIQRVQQHIESHLNEALTIDDAANRALMSRTQFIHRFRVATGQSFLEYVTARRLEQAKILLRDTDWSLLQVSEFIGYKDTTRLHRIFHRIVGMSPIRYREFSREESAQ